MRSATNVEMTTTSIASSGAGAVTCTAITGYPSFTQALGAGACSVQYMIEDTVTHEAEWGIGSVAANVLTRTRPQVTWNGVSTWLDAAPSALTFSAGATPTLGNIRIRLAALAEGQGANMRGRNSVITGDANWRDYRISGHNTLQATGTGMVLTADLEIYSPYRLDVAGLLNGWQFEVMTLASGKNLKAALYSCDFNGVPGAKIVDFVTTSLTTTGVKTDTAIASWTPAQAIWLVPGWYYIGVISDSSVAAIRSSVAMTTVSSTESPLGRLTIAAPAGWASVAGSYTTGLPATPSLGAATLLSANGVAGSPLWFGLKVVA